MRLLDSLHFALVRRFLFPVELRSLMAGFFIISKFNDENIAEAVEIYVYDQRQALLLFGPIELWDVHEVTDMSYVFHDYHAFNEDISRWDVSNVTCMDQMFKMALSFNQPLNQWNVSKVTSMQSMFGLARQFNQPLDSWDVSNVTDMSFMFDAASSFNQTLDTWKLSCQTHMYGIFHELPIFKQQLNNWNIPDFEQKAILAALPYRYQGPTLIVNNMS